MPYTLKRGVSIFMSEQIALMLEIASQIFSFENVPLVVTSGLDGPHRDGSLHYRFRAVDIRSINMTDEQKKIIPDRMRVAFSQYMYPVQVIVETDHIHMEWDEGKKT